MKDRPIPATSRQVQYIRFKVNIEIGYEKSNDGYCSCRHKR